MLANFDFIHCDILSSDAVRRIQCSCRDWFPGTDGRRLWQWHHAVFRSGAVCLGHVRLDEWELDDNALILSSNSYMISYSDWKLCAY